MTYEARDGEVGASGRRTEKLSPARDTGILGGDTVLGTNPSLALACTTDTGDTGLVTDPPALANTAVTGTATSVGSIDVDVPGGNKVCGGDDAKRKSRGSMGELLDAKDWLRAAS